MKKYNVLKWSFKALGVLLVIIGCGAGMGFCMVLRSEGFNCGIALLAIISIAVMATGFVAKFYAHDYALHFATEQTEYQTIYGTVLSTLPKPRAKATLLTLVLPDVYNSKATIEKVLACEPNKQYQVGDQIPFIFIIHRSKDGECLASVNDGPEYRHLMSWLAS